MKRILDICIGLPLILLYACGEALIVGGFYLFLAIGAAIAFLSLSGCETALFDPGTGRKVASFRSDITTGNYKAGATTFTFARMSNSVPTRAALLGANKIVGTVASAGVAIAVPGSGAVPMVGKAAITAVPHLSAPVAKPGD